LKKKIREDSKTESVIDEKCIGKSLLGLTVDIVSIVSGISTCFSPGNILADSLIRRLAG
jgi:hypothetical protein